MLIMCGQSTGTCSRTSTSWAGEFRSVNMAKGVGRSFGDVKTGEANQLLDDVRKRVADTDWGRLGRDTFAERAATVFAYPTRSTRSARATEARRKCSWSTSRSNRVSPSTTAR